MAKALIAGDHAVVRVGVRGILKGLAGIRVVAEPATVAQLTEVVLGKGAELVITEVSLGGRSVFETLQQLKRGRARIAVLIFTAHREEELGLRAIKAGADGYIC